MNSFTSDHDGKYKKYRSKCEDHVCWIYVKKNIERKISTCGEIKLNSDSRTRKTSQRTK